MRIICRFLGQRPRLEDLERQPLSPGVEQGPRPGDRRDSYERVVATEASGVPDPGGPFEALAQAIGGYHIFPPWIVAGLLKREPAKLEIKK